MDDYRGGRETCPVCAGSGRLGDTKEEAKKAGKELTHGGGCMIVVGFFLVLSSAAVYYVSQLI